MVNKDHIIYVAGDKSNCNCGIQQDCHTLCSAVGASIDVDALVACRLRVSASPVYLTPPAKTTNSSIPLPPPPPKTHQRINLRAILGLKRTHFLIQLRAREHRFKSNKYVGNYLISTFALSVWACLACFQPTNSIFLLHQISQQYFQLQLVSQTRPNEQAA